ncbi:caspase family protein [Paraburkholderia nemoris]|uniref:caspase family protein n=1 Tax=Paraburkholderia nemoris TaxID=2793076 RepID=UPI0038B8A093
MAKMLDSETTVAVILGASDWSKAGLGKAKSFLRSAAYFNIYLTRSFPEGLGLNPEFLLNLFDDVAPSSAQLARIRDFIKDIVLDRRDTEKPIVDVLIYYVGHGASDDGDTLHLLVRDSGHGIEAQSSISTRDLAKVLKVAAPQQRRLCIFDCCFSEGAVSAFAAMGGLDEAVTKIAANNLVAEPPNPKRGTLLLCSSPRGSASIGQPNAERTLFTGALLHLLQQGSETRHDPMLSFADIKDDVFEIMLQEYKGSPPRPALHQPNQQDGDLTRLPAFPNVRELRRRAEESVRHEDDRRIEETRRAEEKRLAAAEAKRLEDERLSAEATRLEQGQPAVAQDEEGLGRKKRRWRAIAWTAAGFLVTASAVIYAGYTFLPRLQTPIQHPMWFTPIPPSSSEAAAPVATSITSAPTEAAAPEPPWSGFTVSIVACGIDDSAVARSSEFLGIQGFVYSDPTVRTNTRQKGLAQTSTLLFYDDMIVDRVSKLSSDLSNETGLTIGYAKGKSSIPRNQIILDLVGDECSLPTQP